MWHKPTVFPRNPELGTATPGSGDPALPINTAVFFSFASRVCVFPLSTCREFTPIPTGVAAANYPESKELNRLRKASRSWDCVLSTLVFPLLPLLFSFP